MDKKYTVYMHTSPSQKRYVGITSQTVNARWRGGGMGYKGCSYFWRAIVKYGWDNFQHEIIAEGLTEAKAKQFEKDLIIAYKTQDPSCGYNCTDGGDGVRGWIPSAETRAKISAANKGNQYCLGRQVSDTTRAKMSAVKIGKQVGHRHNLGRKHTDADRAAMSAAQKKRYAKEAERGETA